jgi:hypothetical protein
MTQNKHLPHPEDMILTGDFTGVNALNEMQHVSLKIDGCPAIVWGSHPITGDFFVCTKSAFNKKKHKICYTIADIQQHFGHQDKVAEILTACLMYLPHTDNVYQGDFIGFGGSHKYTPNTITYTFSSIVTESVIVAPHTVYSCDGELCNAIASPLTDYLTSTTDCLFIQPVVDWMPNNDPLIVNTHHVQFMTNKEASVATQEINRCLRNDQELTDSVLFNILGDVGLVNLYQNVLEYKTELMEKFIVTDAPVSNMGHEGFVINGVTKLVNRNVFSVANFATGKPQ